jgi:hypothetical protein
MQPMDGIVTALAVVAIYYIWRGYFRMFLCRERTLRQRVAYMLWVMANPNGQELLEDDEAIEPKFARDVPLLG